MKKIICGLAVIIFLCFLVVPEVSASVFDWKTYETEQFTVFYPQGYDYQAEQTLYYLEKHSAKIDRITGNEANKRVYVVIQDVGLVSNGYASPMHFKINIYTNNPLTDSSLNAYESWERQVNVHEYTHISQMTNSKGVSNKLTTVFWKFVFS